MNVCVRCREDYSHFTDFPCMPAVGQTMELLGHHMFRVTKVVVRPEKRDLLVDVEEIDAEATPKVHSGGHGKGKRAKVPKVRERHITSELHEARRGDQRDGGDKKIPDVP